MSAESSDNIVRRGYRGLCTADRRLLTEVFHEYSTWATPGRTSVAGLREGRNGVLAQFGRYHRDTHGSFRTELLHVTADDAGRAVGIHRSTARRKGKSLDVMCCIEFEIRNGHIISGKEHYFDLYAWDEFWS
jgi:ketosteroid isomerase-like protein